MESPRVMFSTDGRNWWRREWKPQCSHDFMGGRRCQGVAGHDGEHWYYGEDGGFNWELPETEVKSDCDICSGWTPPGHEEYFSPIEMQPHHYRNHFSDSEVTDPSEIERLERGEMQENESITRPVTDEDTKEMLAEFKRTPED